VNEVTKDADTNEDNKYKYENEQNKKDDLIQPRDAFIFDFITNKTSLKRSRALIKSKNVARKNFNNKRIIFNALDKMLGFL
jgi:hypothetical protein